MLMMMMIIPQKVVFYESASKAQESKPTELGEIIVCKIMATAVIVWDTRQDHKSLCGWLFCCSTSLNCFSIFHTRNQSSSNPRLIGGMVDWMVGL